MEGSGKATASSSSTTGSSSSGTIVSASYTSSASQLSSMSSEFGKHECGEDMGRRIISMVQEFFGVPSSESFNGGNMSAVDGWLRELGVGWVLNVAGGDGACAVDLEHAAGAWIRAFAQIMETMHSTASLFPDHDSLGLACISEEEEDEEPMAESCIPDQFQFIRFIQEAMLKMLAFVDAIVAPPPDNPDTTGHAVASRGGVLASCKKLHALLDVRGALATKALSQLWLPSAPHPSRYSAQVVRVQGEMVRLLSAKEDKVCEAIWSTMEEVRTIHLGSTWDPWDAGAQTRRGSSGIHRLTLSIMSYIKFLLINYSVVAPIVCEAARLCKYEPRIGIGFVPPLSSLIMEMSSCLEEKLVNKPESFQDESLRFLFLLNNSYFMWQQLLPVWYFPKFNVSSPAAISFMELTAKYITRVEGYMESYLQVSWASVVSCLFNPMPPFYRTVKASPLTKFESAFCKTYAAQKLWKVPDPELRKKLRKAITEKIMPAYTNFIEDNNVTTPKFIPQELEGMLQELFEG